MNKNIDKALVEEGYLELIQSNDPKDIHTTCTARIIRGAIVRSCSEFGRITGNREN
jgi:hypothetical protein